MTNMMSTVMNSMWGYIDGIAVIGTVYVLSPSGSKLKNSIIVGLVHGVLHGTAANNLVANEKLHTRRQMDESDDFDPILDKPQAAKPAAPVRLPVVPNRNLVHNQPGSERHESGKPTVQLHAPPLNQHSFRTPGIFGLPFGGRKNPFLMS